MYRISPSFSSVREVFLKVLLQMWSPPPLPARPSSLLLGEMNGWGGLRATHRFTSLTSRGVCCEWGMIDTAATELRESRQKSQRGLSFFFFIILMRAAGRRAWQQLRGGIWHRTCPSGTPGIHPPWCIARVIPLVACLSFLVFFSSLACRFFYSTCAGCSSLLRALPNST